MTDDPASVVERADLYGWCELLTELQRLEAEAGCDGRRARHLAEHGSFEEAVREVHRLQVEHGQLDDGHDALIMLGQDGIGDVDGAP